MKDITLQLQGSILSTVSGLGLTTIVPLYSRMYTEQAVIENDTVALQGQVRNILQLLGEYLSSEGENVGDEANFDMLVETITYQIQEVNAAEGLTDV